MVRLGFGTVGEVDWVVAIGGMGLVAIMRGSGVRKSTEEGVGGPEVEKGWYFFGSWAADTGFCLYVIGRVKYLAAAEER